MAPRSRQRPGSAHRSRRGDRRSVSPRRRSCCSRTLPRGGCRGRRSHGARTEQSPATRAFVLGGQLDSRADFVLGGRKRARHHRARLAPAAGEEHRAPARGDADERRLPRAEQRHRQIPPGRRALRARRTGAPAHGCGERGAAEAARAPREDGRDRAARHRRSRERALRLRDGKPVRDPHGRGGGRPGASALHGGRQGAARVSAARVREADRRQRPQGLHAKDHHPPRRAARDACGRRHARIRDRRRGKRAGPARHRRAGAQSHRRGDRRARRRGAGAAHDEEGDAGLRPRCHCHRGGGVGAPGLRAPSRAGGMKKPPAPKPTHTLADHAYGEELEHTHDDESDHDHDHDHDVGPAGAIEDNPLWQADNITLTSVGIDIGSAGTQVIFSRVRMRRMGEDLSSRYFVVGRETLYESPVALTPYSSEVRIDERAIGELIDDAYGAAGIHPDEVDTGSVILTGEALRRENAQAIGELLAEMGGEFVCATAGHHMEAMLAAYGSGAAKRSHDEDKHILNVDIGGGTTKLALVAHGKVEETAAIHVGGRLVVVDEAGRITRLDPQGAKLSRAAGFNWQLGTQVSRADLERLTEWLADTLLATIPARRSDLFLTEPLRELSGIDGVMFSGGVAEYVYWREERDFGDLGRGLGYAIRKRVDAGRFPWRLLPAGECIRATAFGASEYSVQLSGNTVYISSPADLLPRKNLQVLQPAVDLGAKIDAKAVARAIREHFTAFDIAEGENEVALAFRWRGVPEYERLAAFARAIKASLPRTCEQGKPIYLILDGDVGHTIGAILKEDFGLRCEVLVIDGISLRDFDYIDLGRIRMPSHTVPVTIKSLVFSQDPRVPHHH